MYTEGEKSNFLKTVTGVDFSKRGRSHLMFSFLGDVNTPSVKYLYFSSSS